MSILHEREKTHGDYARVSALSQDLKTRIRSEDHMLSYEQLESLEMICVKIARIVCGNPNEPDHWLDVQGYAELVHQSLNKKRTATGEYLNEEPPDEGDYYPSGASVSHHGG